MKTLVEGMKWPKWMIAFAFLFSLIETAFGLVIPLLTMDWYLGTDWDGIGRLG